MIKKILWLWLLLVLPVHASTIFENRNIPLIDNRFRLDESVEKVTFLLYRSPGSPAAILVRPDGSKIYAWQLPSNVSWLETDELDIVTIENPMRGPWQAVAENKGRNRVRILSDVQMITDPIPHQLYQGERVRIRTRLVDKGERIDLGVMLKDAILHVALSHQQLMDDQTLEVRQESLGKFADDGKAYDEYPNDGVFTTQLKLDVKPGKYEMIISTLNQIFTRAQTTPVLIYPNPVAIQVLSPKDEQRQARMALVIDADELRPESVVISGKVFNNVGWQQAFQAYAKDNNEFSVDLPTPTAQGRYRVSGTLLATTLQNREIVIELPEEDFVILPPPPPPPEPVSLEEVVIPEPPTPLWLIILLSVLALVLLAGLAFLVIWWRKRKAFAAALKQARDAPPQTVAPEPKMEDASGLKMPGE